MTKYEPNERGYWGDYGGRFVPETLVAPLDELTAAYSEFRHDKAFRDELGSLLSNYSGRPTPLTFAERLTDMLGGAQIYLKREDLNHTGAHKINNCIGQILLARRMGKKRVIAETGAGQHGVATATVCALFGIECVVYMGTEDMRRQELNVFRMRLLGAEVRGVDSGSRTLKDAINEALRDWVTNVATTYYLLGSALGPHPYPLMVRDFQSVIGRETREQILEREGRLPDVLVACVGGGSNAIGLFHEFLDDEVRMIGVEAGGSGSELGQHAARFMSGGSVGVLQGTKSYLLQDENGQIASTHSISAGLDYASIGPEHAFLHDAGRIEYVSVSDDEALDAFKFLSKTEGIIPALESSHAIAHVTKIARDMPRETIIIANLSGRGDKDVGTVADAIGKRSMSVIAAKFSQLQSSGRKGFIPFVTAGDPDIETSVAIVIKLAQVGADVIELGVPFSDPVADGPTIQRSSQRALANGVNIAEILSMVKVVRKEVDTPIVLFSYYNPLFRYGLDDLSRDAAAAGIDGLLITDVVDDEADEAAQILGKSGLDLISLIAPTTSENRLARVVGRSTGFLYAVSRAGVTGARSDISSDAEALVRRCKDLSDLPVAVGFGISTRDQIADVWRYADAAVVGSAIVAEIERSSSDNAVERVETFVRGILPQFAISGVEL